MPRIIDQFSRAIRVGGHPRLIAGFILAALAGLALSPNLRHLVGAVVSFALELLVTGALATAMMCVTIRITEGKEGAAQLWATCAANLRRMRGASAR